MARTLSLVVVVSLMVCVSAMPFDMITLPKNNGTDIPDGNGGPFGPDVSHYQGKIDWNTVAKQGVSFAIAKATEGNTYVDAEFSTNWNGMKASGIKIRGAYHFGRPAEDAATQAKHFLATVGKISPGDFIALDIEVTDSTSASHVAAWSKQFVDAITSGAGVPASRVLVYTGAWFWNPDAGGSGALADHPLWVSGYVPTAPTVPKGWSTWTFWQYTDKAAIKGINGGVDCSRYVGSEAELLKLAGL